MKLSSYIAGQWFESSAVGKVVCDAVRGDPVCEVSSEGADMAGAVAYAREIGGPALRALTFHERAAALKAIMVGGGTVRRQYVYMLRRYSFSP